MGNPKLIDHHQTKRTTPTSPTDSAAINARKAELTDEITALTLKADQLAAEVESLQTTLKLKMLPYLSDAAAAKLLSDPALLEDEQMMLQAAMAAISQGTFSQIAQLKLLRNEYKLKRSKLKLLHQHRANLQGALQVLGRPDTSEMLLATGNV